MNRFTCLIFLLLLATPPAFSAPAAKRSAYHTAANGRHIRKKAVVQQHAVAHPRLTSEKAQTDAFIGRLIYEEPQAEVTAAPPVIQPKSDSVEMTSNGLVQPQTTKTTDEIKQTSAARTLKASSVELSTKRLDPGIAERSWVSDVTMEQSLQLADLIAAYVAKQEPPDSTILLLAPPQTVQAHNPLTPALNYFLRKTGFGLVESKEQAPNAHVLTYQVSRFNEGLWLQLQLNHSEVNRFYSLNAANSLVADAPFCVREDK
jgi:hypothetical protein